MNTKSSSKNKKSKTGKKPNNKTNSKKVTSKKVTSKKVTSKKTNSKKTNSKKTNSKKVTSKKNNSKSGSKSGSKPGIKLGSKLGSKVGSKVGSKKTNTIRQIRKNIESMKLKLIDKNMMENFWVIADRADFKPLTKIIVKNDEEIKTIIHSIKEIRDHLLDEKGEYYKGKKLASMKIVFNNEVLNKLSQIKYNGILNNSVLTHKDFTNIKNKPIVTVIITIYLVTDTGTIVANGDNSWGLKVNYTIDDFSNIKFKLKNVEVLMRLVSDSVIKSNLSEGITYKNLSTQLNKK